MDKQIEVYYREVFWSLYISFNFKFSRVKEFRSVQNIHKYWYLNLNLQIYIIYMAKLIEEYQSAVFFILWEKVDQACTEHLPISLLFLSSNLSVYLSIYTYCYLSIKLGIYISIQLPVLKVLNVPQGLIQYLGVLL